MSTCNVDLTRLVRKPMSACFSTSLRTMAFRPFARIGGSGVAKLNSLHRLNHLAHDLKASTTFCGSASSGGFCKLLSMRDLSSSPQVGTTS